MEFFAVLDACYTRKDLPGLIRLAARTEGSDLWHMPNGLGPTDAASLRIKALELRANAIFNEAGLLGNEIVSALEASLSAREADLLTQLRVDPADTAFARSSSALIRSEAASVGPNPLGMCQKSLPSVRAANRIRPGRSLRV